MPSQTGSNVPIINVLAPLKNENNIPPTPSLMSIPNIESSPGIALGLELLEAVFFGVPGGVRGGVAPLPFTRDSPGNIHHIFEGCILIKRSEVVKI